MTNARAFTDRLAALLREERAALVDFLLLLADFDRRRLFLELGHPNLFAFLHRELGLSKGAAHYRKVAAGLVQRFPEIVAPLRDGWLCLTSVVELARVLTPENREEVLPQFFHRSKREAAEVAAALRPDESPPRREVVTAVRHAAPAVPPSPAPGPQPAEAEGTAGAPAFHPANHPRANSPSLGPASSSQPPKSLEVVPLTADLRRLHVSVSRHFLEKLEAARAALSHARPGASAEDILEAGLDLLLAKDAKKKGLVERPRAKVRPARPETMPAHVRREVWKRDGGGASGRSNPEGSAARPFASSSTTSCRGRGAVRRPWGTCGSCAPLTISSRRGGSSATPGWIGTRAAERQDRSPLARNPEPSGACRRRHRRQSAMIASMGCAIADASCRARDPRAAASSSSVLGRSSPVQVQIRRPRAGAMRRLRSAG